jgi:hypothetical protein
LTLARAERQRGEGQMRRKPASVPASIEPRLEEVSTTLQTNGPAAALGNADGALSGFTHDFCRERFTGLGSRMLRGVLPTIRLWSLIVGIGTPWFAGHTCVACTYACRGSIKRGASGDCPAGSCLLLCPLLLFAVRGSLPWLAAPRKPPLDRLEDRPGNSLSTVRPR